MIQDPVGLMAFLFLVVAFTRFLEGRFKFVQKISSAVVCTLLGILLSNLGLIPNSGPVNEAVYNYAVPYSIVLVILASNLKDLRIAGARIVACFAIAAVATFAACFVAGLMFAPALGPETWKLSGQFAAGFVGGGMNFVAVGRGLETSPNLFAAASVADNLSTVPYMLAQIGLAAVLTPYFAGVMRFGRRRRAGVPAIAPAAAPEANDPGNAQPATERGKTALEEDPRRYWTHTDLSITDLALLAAAPLGAMWLSKQLAPLLPGFPEVLWLTTMAFVAAQLPFTRRVKGAAVLSYFALHLFFVIIGAGSVIQEVLRSGPALMVYMVVILAIHAVVSYGMAWLLGFDLQTISVASQAAVGGPGSAMALSMAMKWNDLITPGIIVGILGYAVGNYIGFGCAYS